MNERLMQDIEVDPITVEVIRRRLVAIADQVDWFKSLPANP